MKGLLVISKVRLYRRTCQPYLLYAFYTAFLVLCLVHLHQRGVLAIALGHRRGVQGGENVDCPAVVHTVVVKLHPCPLRNGDHSGRNARRNEGLGLDTSAIVVDLNLVPVFYTAIPGIECVDPDLLWMCLVIKGEVAVGGVGALLEVMPDALEGVLLVCARILHTFHRGNIFGNWSDAIALAILIELPCGGQIGQLRRIDLDLAGGSFYRIGLRILPEILGFRKIS